MSTRLAPVAAHAHVQDRGTPPAGLVRQAPDHRVTSHALASTATPPPVLTSNAARQHCMVWPNVLTRHLQPQAIQARERAQIRRSKIVLDMSRSFRWTVSEPPSSEDLDPYPTTTRPTPPTTPTPSNAKSHKTLKIIVINTEGDGWNCSVISCKVLSCKIMSDKVYRAYRGASNLLL